MIYVLDAYNSKLHVSKPEGPLANIVTIGSNGTADSQFLYPNKFSIGRGWHYNIQTDTILPLALGEAFISEHFTSNTGIRRYEFGCDILYHTVNHNPDVTGQDRTFLINRGISGVVSCTTRVYCNGVEVGMEGIDARLPGHYSNETITVPYYPHDANYTIETQINSVYGTYDTTARQEIFLPAPPRAPETFWADCGEGETEDNEIALYWNYIDGLDCECDTFDIYRDSELLTSVPEDSCKAGVGSNYYYWDIFPDNTWGEYTYWIKAREGAGPASDPSYTIITTKSDAIPAPPFDLAVERNTTTCDWEISWQDASDNEEAFLFWAHYGDTWPNGTNHYSFIPRDGRSTTYFNSSNFDQNVTFNLIAIDSIKCATSSCTGNPIFECNGCFICSSPFTSQTVLHTPCNATSCPTLYVWNGNRFIQENNILAISQSDNLATEDFIESHHIKLPLIEENGVYRLQIIENADDISTFDKIALVALDRDNNTKIIMDKAGSFFQKKQTILPTRVIDHRGFVVTKLLQDKDNNFYFCAGPGYLDVEYTNLSTSGANKINDTNAGEEVPDNPITRPPKEWDADTAHTKISPYSGRSGTPNHLDVLIKRDTEWELFETVYGKKYDRDQLLIHLPKDAISDGSLTIRYRWNHGYMTDQVALTTAEKMPNTTINLNMIKAEHSRLGDIKSKLILSDNVNTELLPADTISLIFKSLPENVGKKREFALITKGRYTANTASTFFTELSDTADIVTSFKMSQNYPNPSNPSTTFEFALPQSEFVNLVIYNILGQKVKTVTNQLYEAGKHKIRWDGRNSSGNELASGIYFAKLVAGDNVSTKKVVVLK